MENKLVISANKIDSSEYVAWFEELKSRYCSSQLKAGLSVNRELLQFNWNLGKDIVEKKAEEKWGSGIIERLSLDFKNAFPTQKGFSTTNLWYMKKWYLFYTEKVHQAGGEILELMYKVPWRHHVEIISKCKDVEEAIFYLDETVKNNWSRSALEDVISAKRYEKMGKALTNFQNTLPETQGKLAKAVLKDPYSFDFLSMREGYDERELEDALTSHITRFLLELGKGFAFVGRQVEIVVSDTSYFMDMLFYHIKLKCYVVVELKIVKFEPEFASKLNFYVTAVDKLMKGKDDNPTIGLLICKDKDETKVEWSFDGINKPLGVASYELNIKSDDFKNSLPTIEEIESEIK